MNVKNFMAKSACRVMEHTHHVVHVVDEPVYCSCSWSNCVGTVQCATGLTRGWKQSSRFPKIRFLCVPVMFGVACVYVPVTVMHLRKPSNICIVIITRSACNDERQEFTQLLHLKTESVYGSHLASWLRQVLWPSSAQGPKTPQVCRCYRLVTDVRIWYGITVKVLLVLVCVRQFCFCSVYQSYVASNTELTWNERSLCVCVCAMYVHNVLHIHVCINHAVCLTTGP